MRERRRFLELIFLIAAIVWLASVGTRTAHFYGGDEPHYLVMTKSIIQDHDVDLRNDYESQRYLTYYPFKLDPHVSSGRQPAGFPHWYSIHGLGLPILLAGPVALFGVRAADATMVGIALILVILTYLWAKRLTADPLASAIASATLASAMFFAGLARYLYPDLLIAACLAGLLILLRQTQRRVGGWFLIGFLLGAAAWIHFKTFAFTIPLGIWSLISVSRELRGRDQDWRRPVALLIPWAGLTLLFFLKLHAWYNVWIPSQIYPETAQLFQVSPLVTIPAILFDAAKGLLIWNPALLLILVGLPLWYRRDRRSFWLAASATLPMLAMLATFSDWSGGYAPAGRYLLEMIPALVPASAFAWMTGFKILRWLIAALLALQLVFTGVLLSLHAPVFDIHARNPVAIRIEQLTRISIDRIAPRFSLDYLLSGGQWLWVYGFLIVLAFASGMWLAADKQHGLSVLRTEK